MRVWYAAGAGKEARLWVPCAQGAGAGSSQAWQGPRARASAARPQLGACPRPVWRPAARQPCARAPAAPAGWPARRACCRRGRLPRRGGAERREERGSCEWARQRSQPAAEPQACCARHCSDAQAQLGRQARGQSRAPTRDKQLLVQRVPGGVRHVLVVPPEAGQLALHAHVVQLSRPSRRTARRGGAAQRVKGGPAGQQEERGSAQGRWPGGRAR